MSYKQQKLKKFEDKFVDTDYEHMWSMGGNVPAVKDFISNLIDETIDHCEEETGLEEKKIRNSNSGILFKENYEGYNQAISNTARKFKELMKGKDDYK